MKILKYENWKKQIVFDNIIYKEVKRFSLNLNSFERNIMDSEINFYRTHFSIKQIMDSYKLCKNDSEKETFMRAVLKRQDNILYLPNSLKSYFIKIAKSEFSECIGFMSLMIDKACKASTKNPIVPIIKKLLGSYFSPVSKKIKKISKETEIPVHSKVLKPEAIGNTARDYIRDLQMDLRLSQIYGRSSIRKSVPISIVDDYGYGEWVSKNVSYASNRFFIYSNHNKLTDVRLKHMVYFNVYPGYGHFYNTVVDDVTKNTCFDNGGSYLINGWAMYAMCHSGTAYSQNFMIEGANIAKCLLNKNLEKGFTDAYIYLLGKYSKNQAIDYMIDYACYPGHYLSYVLGGLCIECIMDSDFANNPIEFLDNLSNIDCGDFLALYSPKMQKKIAKLSITGKVAKKFSGV